MRYQIIRVIDSEILDPDDQDRMSVRTQRGWEQSIDVVEDINKSMTRAASYQHLHGHSHRYYLVEEVP